MFSIKSFFKVVETLVFAAASQFFHAANIDMNANDITLNGYDTMVDFN
ncbi:MAG: hypothetical protein KUG78_08730 [Kangiellaceae bacterium]|nr:hypothetical protein [Kangiellaceae bacterium]